MRNKVLIGVAALAVLAPAPAQAAKSKVTITSYVPGDIFAGDPSEFGGEVESSKAKCEKKRKVTLFREETGDDIEIGTAKTKASGAFVIEDFGGASDNAYYATIGRRDGCSPDRSADYFIP